jgi:lipoprotein-releasing system ATP-binding protein
MNNAAIGKFDRSGDKPGKSTGIETPVPMAAAASPLISAREVDKSFHDAGREVVVLRGLDLEVAAGEEIAIIGQSGVGKSTLLHVIGSLERPTGGKVLFEDRDLFAMDERETAQFRNRNLGFVFQFHYLLADFSALENVMMPALIARLPDRQARDMAASVLERVGLKDKGHRRPAELSGGEQQRVAVARAVVLGPRLVLADEPTGNLDPKTADEVHEVFHRLNRELGLTLVVATHNERLSSSMTRTLRLRDGKLFPETV